MLHGAEGLKQLKFQNLVRKVSEQGTIRWQGDHVHVSRALDIARRALT